MAKLIVIEGGATPPPKRKEQNGKRERDPAEFLKNQHKRMLREMNRDHALVVAQDRVEILHVLRDDTGGVAHLSFRSEAECDLIHRARPYFKYTSSEKSGPKWSRDSRTKAWLSDPKRRMVRSVVNAPQPWGADPLPLDTLNLWLGYGTAPAPMGCARVGGTGYQADWPQECSLILEHVLDIWCDRNMNLFRWTMAWLAQMVQVPDVLPGTMLVIQGGQGAGKGIIVQALARILGNGFLTINSKRYLVGNFNGILQGRLLVFADELFVKDPEAKNALKNKVSEPFITVELKGKEPFSIANTARVLMATNESHAIDAEADDRRACVLRASSRRRVPREASPDHEGRPYFNALAREVLGTGPAHLFRYLLEVDWRSVDLRTPPTTKALVDQKIASLLPLQRWWFERLTAGTIVSALDGHEPGWSYSTTRMQLAASFDRHADRLKLSEHKKPGHADVWRFCFDKEGSCQFERTGGRDGGGDREYRYSVPSLDDARQRFAVWLSVPPELISWGDEEGETNSSPPDEVPF